MKKPRYLILSTDEDLARYVVWNEGIPEMEARYKIMGWPEKYHWENGRTYRVVPESEMRFHAHTKLNYENFARRIREASAFMQGRIDGATSWSAYAFVVKAVEL